MTEPKGTETTESKALAVIQKSVMAAVRMEPGELAAIIGENLGGTLTSPYQLDRIRMPAGGGTVWMVPSLDNENGDPKTSLDGVLIYKREGQRGWYKLSYEESQGAKSPPDCFSTNGITGSNAEVGARLNKAGRPVCSTCPKAQYGSARKGGKGQDCAQRSMVFFLPDASLIPVLIVAPPTSLSPLAKYYLRLSSIPKAYWSIRTGLKLEQVKGAITYSVIHPVKLTDLEPEERERLSVYREQLIPFFEGIRLDQEDISDYDSGLSEG